jgi:hypothetical protein
VNTPMASPRSFRRTIRAAYLKLVYSTDQSPAENLQSIEEAIKRVSLSIPLPLHVVAQIEEQEEVVPLEIDKSSVLALPRRDRDPALVQQEIKGCKALLLEVIRRAAYDWVLYRSSTRILHKKLAEQAFCWLFMEDEEHPDWKERRGTGKHITAFMAICSALDLDVRAVRTHVQKLTPKNVMSVGRPPEYRRREPASHSSEDVTVSLEPTELEDEWAGNFDE